MGDWRQMGHAQRRRMGAPSNHFGAAQANKDDDEDSNFRAVFGDEAENRRQEDVTVRRSAEQNWDFDKGRMKEST